MYYKQILDNKETPSGLFLILKAGNWWTEDNELMSAIIPNYVKFCNEYILYSWFFLMLGDVFKQL